MPFLGHDNAWEMTTQHCSEAQNDAATGAHRERPNRRYGLGRVSQNAFGPAGERKQWSRGRPQRTGASLGQRLTVELGLTVADPPDLPQLTVLQADNGS